MPKRKFRRTTRKAGVRSRRRPKRVKRTKRMPVLWPTRKAVRLNYAEHFDANTLVGGIVVQYNYSANGIFDPNITGGGHQPKGFDQVMSNYDHYVVVGTKISVEFVNKTEHPIRVGIMLRDSAPSGTASIEGVEEYRFKRFTTLDGITMGGKSYGTVSMAINPAKFLGRSKALSDSQLKGNVSTNPAEQCYFVLFAYALDATQEVSVSGAVKIDYSTVFIEPKLGVGS